MDDSSATPASSRKGDGQALTFEEYQRRALETNHNDLTEPQGEMPAILGLASETGSILNVYKKRLRDRVGSADAREFLKQEIGDLLWYVAIVCAGAGLTLADVAAENLQRASNRYGRIGANPENPPSLDADYPMQERFPRRLSFAFQPAKGGSGGPRNVTYLIAAEAEEYPRGPLQPDAAAAQRVGFFLGKRIGESMDDNDWRADGYRFHDAIHMGFLAVLGWSPVLRGFLHLKRKSNPETDRQQDGARAVFKEEGLAAVLAEMSKSRLQFQSPLTVNGEVLDVIRAVTRGLEVASIPDYWWTRAVSEGFKAMESLQQHGGGTLHLDLDEHRITFEGPTSPGAPKAGRGGPPST